MTSKSSYSSFLGALTVVWAAQTPAFAGQENYEFQLVEEQASQGSDTTVAVRLVDKRTEKAVPDAVIFTTRMDMAPEGMEAMTTPVQPLPSQEPGIYRFKTKLSMEGGWRFKLAAKVQGETDTVQGELVLQARQ